MPPSEPEQLRVAGAGVGAIPGALIGGGVGAGAGAATKPDQVNLGQPVWREGGAQEAQSTPAEWAIP
jgi:hypothetical protein